MPGNSFLYAQSCLTCLSCAQSNACHLLPFTLSLSFCQFVPVAVVGCTTGAQSLFVQVTVFAGKAAVPLGGIFGFQKAFFLHPETDELYGRVQLQKGPLGNALYPLYYRASVEASIIAGTIILAVILSNTH